RQRQARPREPAPGPGHPREPARRRRRGSGAALVHRTHPHQSRHRRSRPPRWTIGSRVNGPSRRGIESSPMAPGPSKARIVLAFAAVYLIWGSTYLGIRYAIATLPPLLMAGVRFVTAGAILFTYARKRGAALPKRRHIGPAFIIGALMMLVGNG